MVMGITTIRIKMIKKNAIILIERYIWILSGFIYTFYLAKTMSVDAYGRYSLVLSYVTIVSFYSLLSLQQIDVRDVISKKSKPIDLIVGKLSISLFIFVIVCIITYLYSDFLIGEVEYISILILLLSYLFNGACYAEIITQSNLEIERYLIVKVIITISSLIFKLVFTNENFTLLDASLFFMIDYLLFFIWSCVYIWKNLPRYSTCMESVSFLFCIKSYIFRVKENYHLVISSIIILIYSKIDQYMIGTLNGDMGNVAYLSVLSKVQDGFIIVITTLGLTSFPGLVMKRNSKEYNSLARGFILKTLVLLLILSTAYYTFIPYFINFIFGVNIDVNIVLIYAISMIFCGLNIATGRLLIIDGLSSYALYRNVIALLVNLSANYILIPSLSIKGAAIASLLSWSISGFLFLILLKKTRFYFLK